MIKSALGVLLVGAVFWAGGGCSSNDSGGSSGSGGGGAAGGGGTGGSDSGADSGSCNTSDPGATIETCFTPDPTGTPQLDGAVLAVSYIYADEQRDKTKDPANVWKTIGFDLDGQSTDASSANHCKPTAGADATSVKTDGDNGIDNAFLKNVAPIIAGVSPGWADSWNLGLASGGATILLDLPDLVLPAPGSTGTPGNGTKLAARGYTSVPLCVSEGGTEGGTDAGAEAGADAGAATRQVAVDRGSICGPSLDQPRWSAPDGTLDGDVWVSGKIPDATLIVPLKGNPLAVHLRDVHVQMTLSADRRSATMGTIAGIADMEELISQFTLIRGAILAGLCSPTLKGVFDGYIARARKAADIMSDGTQDPQKTCNGISVGLGFDAHVVQVRGIVTTPPSSDTCADH